MVWFCCLITQILEPVMMIGDMYFGCVKMSPQNLYMELYFFNLIVVCCACVQVLGVMLEAILLVPQVKSQTKPSNLNSLDLFFFFPQNNLSRVLEGCFQLINFINKQCNKVTIVFIQYQFGANSAQVVFVSFCRKLYVVFVENTRESEVNGSIS